MSRCTEMEEFNHLHTVCTVRGVKGAGPAPFYQHHCLRILALNISEHPAPFFSTLPLFESYLPPNFLGINPEYENLVSRIQDLTTSK